MSRKRSAPTSTPSFAAVLAARIPPTPAPLWPLRDPVRAPFPTVRRCPDGLGACTFERLPHSEHPPLVELLALPITNERRARRAGPESEPVIFRHISTWEIPELIQSIASLPAAHALLSNPTVRGTDLVGLARHVAMLVSASQPERALGEQLLEVLLEAPQVPRAALLELAGLQGGSEEAIFVLASHPRATDELRLRLLVSLHARPNAPELQRLVGTTSELARAAAGIARSRDTWTLPELRSAARLVLSQTAKNRTAALSMLDVLPGELGLPPVELARVLRALL